MSYPLNNLIVCFVLSNKMQYEYMFYFLRKVVHADKELIVILDTAGLQLSFVDSIFGNSHSQTAI
jgi:hypothetical protein